jgi:hypothetical protein
VPKRPSYLGDPIVTNPSQHHPAGAIREVVSKIEVRFTHERTDGKKSPTGKGRLYNKVSEVILYVRAGLGMSCLSTLDCSGIDLNVV